MAVDSRDPDSVTTRELRYNNQPSTKHNIINLFTKEITKDRDERTLIFDGVDEVTAEGVRCMDVTCPGSWMTSSCTLRR